MKERLKILVGFTIAFMLTMFVLDVFMSIGGVSRKSEVSYNTELGKELMPNYNFIWFTEGFAMGSVNKFGYLGPDYASKKPKETKRIALLGDSYIEGVQVFERNHFRGILEEKLNANQDSVQVLNFGRSNFNFSNMYAYHQLKVSKYNPDLVLYFVSQEDLWINETDILLPNVNKETLDVVVSLDQSSVPSFKMTNGVLQTSSFAYMLNSARRKVKKNGVVNAVFDGKFQKNDKVVLLEENQLSELSASLLEKLDTTKVIIVYREKARMPISAKTTIEGLGFRVIDLSPFLRALDAEGKNPNQWRLLNSDGHWNIEGHKAVGDYLAKLLSSSLD